MIKILFICTGNICRSPMAEFLLKDMVSKKGLADRFFIVSAATSNEEYGNPVHHGTREILTRLGISCDGKTAKQMKASDYELYDYIIGMDDYNIRCIQRILQYKDRSLKRHKIDHETLSYDPEHKVHKLLEYTGSNRDIDDPWYTGDFETAYRDIRAGCEAFLNFILQR